MSNPPLWLSYCYGRICQFWSQQLAPPFESVIEPWTEHAQRLRPLNAKYLLQNPMYELGSECVMA